MLIMERGHTRRDEKGGIAGFFSPPSLSREMFHNAHTLRAYNENRKDRICTYSVEEGGQ